MLPHHLLIAMVSDEKSAVTQIIVPLYVMCHFVSPGCCQDFRKKFWCSEVWFWRVCHDFLCIYPAWGSLSFLNLYAYVFHQIRRVLAIISSNIPFILNYCSCPSGTPMRQMLAFRIMLCSPPSHPFFRLNNFYNLFLIQSSISLALSFVIICILLSSHPVTFKFQILYFSVLKFPFESLLLFLLFHTNLGISIHLRSVYLHELWI